jgi:hypothetical protein
MRALRLRASPGTDATAGGTPEYLREMVDVPSQWDEARAGRAAGNEISLRGETSGIRRRADAPLEGPGRARALCLAQGVLGLW